MNTNKNHIMLAASRLPVDNVLDNKGHRSGLSNW